MFKTEVIFLFGDRKECNKYLKKIGNRDLITDDKETIMGEILKLNNGAYRIIYCNSIKDGATLVHELYHLVTRILHDRGMISLPNTEGGYIGDETGAYLIEYYYKEVSKKIKNKKGKR